MRRGLAGIPLRRVMLPALTALPALPVMLMLLGALAVAALAAATPAAEPAADPAPPPATPVTAGRVLRFPVDYGSHPLFRTEWWYVTGWLATAQGAPLGFQITFFRTRPGLAESNPSAFAPRQLLIAHVALSDPGRGRLWRDQRVRRAGMGIAEAREGDTDVWVGDWSLRRTADAYRASLAAEDFALDLTLEPTQPPLLNGDRGFSKKDPAADAASYYYRLPHLAVTGQLAGAGGAGRREAVSGEAWLDHEWSSEYLDADAVGWDWIGIDLDQGAALMAFRIRGADGKARWAGGTLRDADGQTHSFAPAEVEFTPRRTWRSARTGIRYPVAWTVRVGGRSFDLQPLMDDQENDARLSTGAIYWEGAVRVSQAGKPVGRGYLELTGYGEKLRLGGAP